MSDNKTLIASFYDAIDIATRRLKKWIGLQYAVNDSDFSGQVTPNQIDGVAEPDKCEFALQILCINDTGF